MIPSHTAYKDSLRKQIETTRQKFLKMLDGIDAMAWHIPSGNPAWTIGEVVYHITMATEFIPADVHLIRTSPLFPRFPAGLFHRLNPALTRRLARGYDRQAMAERFESLHQKLLHLLDDIAPSEWEKGARYPDVDPPLLSGFVTIADLFRYHSWHFESHCAEVRLGLDLLARAADMRASSEPAAADPFTVPQDGVMAYPESGWRRAAFKAPVLLHRLGLGALMGRVILLITQTGRRSGLSRHTLVEYHTLNGVRYVASAYGRSAQWYRNIEADPRVTIQADRPPEPARARRVTADGEILAVCQRFLRRDPPLTRWYLRSRGIDPHDPLDWLLKKDRLYFLRFDPVDEVTPPPLPADLVWVWPFAILGIAAMILGFWKRRSGSSS